MAHLMQRHRRDRLEWLVKWRDPYTRRWRTTSCESRGAHNATLRRRLLEEIRGLERERHDEIARIGGSPSYETPEA